MSNLQQALTQVGFQPSKKTKATLEQLIDDVITPITKPAKTRVIQVQRAGGFVKARWHGEPNCVFGISPEEAHDKLLSGQLGRLGHKRKRFGKHND